MWWHGVVFGRVPDEMGGGFGAPPHILLLNLFALTHIPIALALSVIRNAKPLGALPAAITTNEAERVHGESKSGVLTNSMKYSTRTLES